MTYTVEQNRAWYNSLPGKRVSAATVLRRDDTVLMVKATYKDYWTFPGGVVDEGESPFAAAVRETAEEVGVVLDPQTVQFMSCIYIPERHGFLDRVHFFFQAMELPGDVELALQASEIAEAEWVPITEIAKRADDRSSYRRIQVMLETGDTHPYFEAI